MNGLASPMIHAITLRFGVHPVSRDLDGLTRLYKAWCLNIPFDNLRKVSFLLSEPGAPLPLLDAKDFFADWLADGIGGTCWQSADALYCLLDGLGFNAQRAVGSMLDTGFPGHATTLVTLDDGTNWVLDNALCTMSPLCIDTDDPGLVIEPPHFGEVEIESDGGVVVFGNEPVRSGLFFRLLDRDSSADAYEKAWQASAQRSIFNGVVHIRRNFADRILVLRGRVLYCQDASGLRGELLGADGIVHCLHALMGVSEAFLNTWSATGALANSLVDEEVAPPTERRPPSRR